jgi:hypothetical protein
MGKVRELQNRISLPASTSADEFRDSWVQTLLDFATKGPADQQALLAYVLDKPCGDPDLGARCASRTARLGQWGMLFAASIQVAMAAANCHILEVTQGCMPMMWDLFNEPFDIRPDGTAYAPDQAGLGFTSRADALERFRYVDGSEYEF